MDVRGQERLSTVIAECVGRVRKGPEIIMMTAFLYAFVPFNHL